MRVIEAGQFPGIFGIKEVVGLPLSQRRTTSYNL